MKRRADASSDLYELYEQSSRDGPDFADLAVARLVRNRLQVFDYLELITFLYFVTVHLPSLNGNADSNSVHFFVIGSL